MSDKWGVITLFIVILIFILAAYISLYYYDSVSQEQQRNFFMNKQICPLCGWEGFASQMEVIKQDGITYFFCPVCGAYIGEI
jgi:formate dehydrogenase maturation protein FdhE